MTDVYIAYAREDRESVRTLSEMLRFEGWDVWMDPSEPSTSNSAAVDLKLGSAGAILVVWSGYSRGSEYVRSENHSEVPSSWAPTTSIRARAAGDAAEGDIAVRAYFALPQESLSVTARLNTGVPGRESTRSATK